MNRRSDKKEILDEENIPAEELHLNLKELHSINKYLGGHRVTLQAVKKAGRGRNGLIIADIGCGGGDTLKYLYAHLPGEMNPKLFGIDIKRECIEYCNKNNPKRNIKFIQDDYRNVYKHLPGIDMMTACLFCHHLSRMEIIELIRLALAHKTILVINDLERNMFACYAIKILTKLFSKSRLVKHDAPLSVLRGFKKREWLEMIKEAGARKFSVTNRWAFRHEVIIYE
jgi:2-polyprenyl-3-methyl-5-hydroxy-6-metoxy-1,4-benzoquinol methylase